MVHRRIDVRLDDILAGLKVGVAEAEKLGKPFTIVVVDDGGNLKSMVRMDGAPLGSIQVATDKAYTAVAFRRPTHKWFDVLEADAILGRGAPTGIHRLITFGGGLPVVVDSQVPCAVGVSGAHHSEDTVVAEAVAAAIEERAK